MTSRKYRSPQEDTMVKVRISIEDDGKSITVQDTIRDDPGSVEVLAATAFVAWRAVTSAD
jgi:hypothetical protein